MAGISIGAIVAITVELTVVITAAFHIISKKKNK
jgi:hypothetical protein